MHGLRRISWLGGLHISYQLELGLRSVPNQVKSSRISVEYLWAYLSSSLHHYGGA